jgi:hypothetical protein
MAINRPNIRLSYCKGSMGSAALRTRWPVKVNSSMRGMRFTKIMDNWLRAVVFGSYPVGSEDGSDSI